MEAPKSHTARLVDAVRAWQSTQTWHGLGVARIPNQHSRDVQEMLLGKRFSNLLLRRDKPIGNGRKPTEKQLSREDVELVNSVPGVPARGCSSTVAASMRSCQKARRCPSMVAASMRSHDVALPITKQNDRLFPDGGDDEANSSPHVGQQSDQVLPGSDEDEVSSSECIRRNCDDADGDGFICDYTSMVASFSVTGEVPSASPSWFQSKRNASVASSTLLTTRRKKKKHEKEMVKEDNASETSRTRSSTNMKRKKCNKQDDASGTPRTERATKMKKRSKNDDKENETNQHELCENQKRSEKERGSAAKKGR